MTNFRVVTVTLNPALDMTGGIAELKAGAVNLIQSSNLNPGGKGINVAKVLAELGAEVTVTGFLGDENQVPFKHLFEQKNIHDAFIRVAGASRTNVKLVEEPGRVTDLNFPGIAVSEDAVQKLERVLHTLAETHDVFVIAGSLPSGISTEKLTSWITVLREQGKKVFFDSSNAALAAGLKASPWLVKPNDEELSHWAGRHLSKESELLETGNTLGQTGINNVVISRGSEGVLWLKDGVWFASKPPKIKVVSTVGAGDTLVAGMCWAQLNQWDRETSLSFATALSALAVTQVNVGVEDITQVEAFQRQVTVKLIKND
ncbi:1-phosphofructokinase [Grimontia kaedaensis]|uniref:Phosphofructokinase n=1 Tax=Grimontia kaedaensis TaxID=2872157 RepID=A0ABY4WNH6_9GAMM|nr:1-phosphofructokinase [Grimontia kaedaensis]USH01049.1 1-phosphofructokinase [Grimontia kaedaensis]